MAATDKTFIYAIFEVATIIHECAFLSLFCLLVCTRAVIGQMIYRQIFLNFIAKKNIKLFFTLNYVLKRANYLRRG